MSRITDGYRPTSISLGLYTFMHVCILWWLICNGDKTVLKFTAIESSSVQNN